MITGIGTDIIKRNKLFIDYLDEKDPFMIKTYSPKEIEQSKSRPVQRDYLETRFAGKEAVFKCMNIQGERIELNEIEILSDEWGKPKVNLYGRALELAIQRNIRSILISLSYEDEFVFAYAKAQG